MKYKLFYTKYNMFLKGSEVDVEFKRKLKWVLLNLKQKGKIFQTV